MGRASTLDQGHREDRRFGTSQPGGRPCHCLPGALLLCLLPLAAGALQIEVQPRPALVDQRLVIRLAGLAPHEEVSLRAEMTDQDAVAWASEVVFRAGSDGMLDLARAVPVSGSYAEAGAESWAEALRFLRAIDWFGDPSSQADPHSGRKR